MSAHTAGKYGSEGRVATWRARPQSGCLMVAALGVVVAATASSLVLGVGAPKAAAATASSGCGAGEPKLTVQGSAQASQAPDIVTVAVAVSTVGQTAADALGANNTAAAQAIAAFRAGGVASRDIQTSGLSLSPQYLYPNGVPQLTGYGATNSIGATIRHIATSGTVIDAVSAAGGDALRIDSLNFSLSRPVTIEDRARSEAVTQAASHARAMATAAGRKLGAVCSLVDQTPLATSLSAGDQLRALPGTPASSATPVEPGAQSDSAEVTITYALDATTSSGQ